MATSRILFEREQTQTISSDGLRLIRRFTIEDLFHIEQILASNDTIHNEYTKEQFSQILFRILNERGTIAEYEELFEKVDFLNEGYITWDKLCSFILLEYYETDTKTTDRKIFKWSEIKPVTTRHKAKIIDIKRFSKSGRLCSVSKDGVFQFWDKNWTETRHEQLIVNKENAKQKDLWVTHFDFLPNANKIVLTLTSKEIVFHDLSSNTEFECTHNLHGLENTPLCISYYSNQFRPNQGWLCFGDSGGYVHIIYFNNVIFSLFDRPSNKPSHQCVHVNIKDLNNQSNQSCQYYVNQSHFDWVRHVSYASYLECFISCATSNKNTMILNWVDKETCQIRPSIINVYQGINHFDYSEKLNTIATAGINHMICLWNPYVMSKPIGLLRGHMHSVLNVLFISNKAQLLSLGKDKVIRLWDTHLQICLQRISDRFRRIGGIAIPFYFDTVTSRLIWAFDNELNYLDAKTDSKDRIISHRNPVTACLIISEKQQMITACTGSVVTVWMLETGQKVKQFANAHGTSEILTLAKDVCDAKFLSGSTDGEIKIWDYNGHCFHVLHAGVNREPCDISQIIATKLYIIAIGWSKSFCYFLRSEMDDFHCMPTVLQCKTQPHNDDIVTIATTKSHFIITASVDHILVIWNMSIEAPVRVINLNSGVLPDNTSDDNALDHRDVNRPISCTMSFVCKIISLRKRPFTEAKCSNLICSFTSGVIQFWNAIKGKKFGQMQIHNHCSSMTIAVDDAEKYLASGDSSGCCKIHLLPIYCQQDVDYENREQNLQLLSTINNQTDAISSIVFYRSVSNLFIITASLDCSVCIYHINGQCIGIFGQIKHWNLLTKTIGTEPEKVEITESKETEDIISADQNNSISNNRNSARETRTVRDLKTRVLTDRTIGNGEQKYFKQMFRDKIEKRSISLPSINSNEQLSGMIFNHLDCTKIDTNYQFPRKPDFVSNPSKYFSNDHSNGRRRKSSKYKSLPNINERNGYVVSKKFDEKSLFPKYMLDNDIKLKTVNVFASRSRIWNRSLNPNKRVDSKKVENIKQTY